MGDKWKDKGRAGGLYNNSGIPGPDERIVENEETGERGSVYVHDKDDVGKKIEEGKIHKKK